MAVTAERVAVATAAVALNPDGTAGTTLVVHTDGDIALGGSDVTFATGYLLAVTDSPLTVHVDSGDVLYAISDTSANVQVLRT